MLPYLRQEKSGALLLDLWVQPGASKSGFAGAHGARLKVRVASPPVDGKANLALLKFLAKALGVPPRDLELVSGETSRGKTVRIVGISAQALSAVLPPGSPPEPSAGP